MISSSLDATALAPDVSPRFALRASTAAAHARVDTLYSRLDLSRPDDYARFLLSHAAAFIPVEDALIAAGADDIAPGWSARRRGPALAADLDALGLSAPPPRAAPRFAEQAAVLGGMYVLEGSRLGGAMLARGVAAGLPTAFLKPEPASSWRAFTTLLDDRLADPAALDAATVGAKAVFTVFEQGARADLELPPSAE